jgi:UDP-glucuronate 4-epimerase
MPGAMRALVTGGAGFIGSHVADRLLGEGWEVTSLDNFDPYYDPAQKRRNVAAAQQRSGYRLLERDIRDQKALEDAFEQARPDVVVHLAARAGVRASVEDPRSYLEVNERGGLNVLLGCQQRGGIPLVFASTSSVYGNCARVPFREDDPATAPLSPYAASKRAAELMVHAFHHLHRQPAAVLRFFTVYGPRGRPDMALWSFTRALRRAEPIRLHGEQTERDFTYIDDIVDGVLGAVGWVVANRGYDTFNLGRSQPVRVRELIELLARELGVTPRVTLGELQPGESRATAADVSRARQVFGYQPEVSLAQGLRRWVAWVDGSDEAPAQLRSGSLHA